MRIARFIILLLLLLPLCFNTTYAQNGFTKYNVNNSGSSVPYNFFVFKDTLIFNGLIDSIYGREACIYDNVNPPQLLQDINYGPSNSNFRCLYVDSGFMYFFGGDAVNFGIFKYNINTQSITSLIDRKNIRVDDYFFTVHNNFIFFSGNHTTQTNFFVYGYDIITQITDTIISVPPINGNQAYPNNLFVVNNKLYITMQGWDNSGLYSYDINTKKVDTIINKLRHVGDAVDTIGNEFYFVADDIIHGSELYMYDGINPAMRVTDYHPGTLHTLSGSAMKAMNNKLYFEGNDAAYANSALMEYDPATKQVLEIYQNNAPMGFYPGNLYVYHNKLYMYGFVSFVGAELFVYDGINPPHMLINPFSGVPDSTHTSYPTGFIQFHDDLFFSASDSTGDRELFRYNDSALIIPKSINNTITVGKNLSVYPNPAKDYVIFEYNVPENSVELKLSITNVAGQEIHSITILNRNKGRSRWTIGDNPPGVYIYKLYFGNMAIDLGRIVVTK